MNLPTHLNPPHLPFTYPQFYGLKFLSVRALKIVCVQLQFINAPRSLTSNAHLPSIDVSKHPNPNLLALASTGYPKAQFHNTSSRDCTQTASRKGFIATLKHIFIFFLHVSLVHMLGSCKHFNRVPYLNKFL